MGRRSQTILFCVLTTFCITTKRRLPPTHQNSILPPNHTFLIKTNKQTQKRRRPPTHRNSTLLRNKRHVFEKKRRRPPTHQNSILLWGRQRYVFRKHNRRIPPTHRNSISLVNKTKKQRLFLINKTRRRPPTHRNSLLSETNTHFVEKQKPSETAYPPELHTFTNNMFI